MGGDLTKIKIDNDKIIEVGDNYLAYSDTMYTFADDIKDKCFTVLKYIVGNSVTIGIYDGTIYTITDANLVCVSNKLYPGMFGYRVF
jgi:hypothetical protein